MRDPVCARPGLCPGLCAARSVPRSVRGPVGARARVGSRPAFGRRCRARVCRIGEVGGEGEGEGGGGWVGVGGIRRGGGGMERWKLVQPQASGACIQIFDHSLLARARGFGPFNR